MILSSNEEYLERKRVIIRERIKRILNKEILNNYSKMLNIVHLCLLERLTFKNICKLLHLKEHDLIRFIGKINETNNEIILVSYNGGVPEINYDQIIYKVHNLKWPKKTLKFMCSSDEHIGHVNDRIIYLHKLYEIGELRGVDYAFSLGDKANGPIERAKNTSKIRIGDLDGLILELQKYHPNNIPTYYVVGNHEIGFMETNQCDFGRMVEKNCDNIYFLNNFFAPVNIGRFRVNFTHGYTEGIPIASSNLSKETKFLQSNNPHMICQGHFHEWGIGYDEYRLLCQIHGLKVSRYGEAGGAIFSVNETKDEFEIEWEKIDFKNPNIIKKGEMVLKKVS